MRREVLARGPLKYVVWINSGTFRRIDTGFDNRWNCRLVIAKSVLKHEYV